jgi:hypothetical protein
VAGNPAMEQLGEEVSAAPSLDGSLPTIPLVLPPGLPLMVKLRPPVPLGPFCFLCVGSGGCASHSLSGWDSLVPMMVLVAAAATSFPVRWLLHL